MPFNVKVRLIKAFLKDRGWTFKNSTGDHHQYVHPTLRGRVTVDGEGNDDIPPGTLASILKQAHTTKKELQKWLNR